jgi:hypothetical protein
MNSKIVTLLLWTGLLTTVAFAENPMAAEAPVPAASASPPLAPNQIVSAPRLPGVAELYSVGAMHGLAGQLVARAENSLGGAHRATDGRALLFSYQVMPDARSFPAQKIAPTAAYSAMPFQIDRDDPDFPTYWFPSISFRFDLPRHPRS